MNQKQKEAGKGSVDNRTPNFKAREETSSQIKWNHNKPPKKHLGKGFKKNG